jgi:hypothetical protein
MSSTTRDGCGRWLAQVAIMGALLFLGVPLGIAGAALLTPQILGSALPALLLPLTLVSSVGSWYAAELTREITTDVGRAARWLRGGRGTADAPPAPAEAGERGTAVVMLPSAALVGAAIGALAAALHDGLRLGPAVASFALIAALYGMLLVGLARAGLIAPPARDHMQGPY